MPIEIVCNAFDISRSSYYEYRQRRNRVDVKRLALKAQVSRLFTKSRVLPAAEQLKVCSAKKMLSLVVSRSDV
jgi:putative transposase